MYNDPNQPQQEPYGQGQPSYGQAQVPYGVPPVSFVSPQQPRKRRRWLWIILGIIVVLLLACAGGIFALVNLVSHNPATDVVNHYYTAIKSQDYPTAYQYLDPSMKLSSQGASQQVTPALFTQVGQAVDGAKGKVTNYTISSTALNSNNGVNTANFTVSVTRNGPSYDVHLQLQQEGSDWKLVSFDSL